MLPKAGDIAWVEFDPVRGTEQAGRRPALVVTEHRYHVLSGRAFVCPITSRARPWPFDVPLATPSKTRGFVLTDQTRAIDISERLFRIVETVPDETLRTVRQRIAALIGIDLNTLTP